MTNQELVEGIARNIGALVSRTNSKEAVRLLNELLLLLFKVQAALDEEGDGE